jgi:hypothetical protein
MEQKASSGPQRSQEVKRSKFLVPPDGIKNPTGKVEVHCPLKMSSHKRALVGTHYCRVTILLENRFYTYLFLVESSQKY